MLLSLIKVAETLAHININKETILIYDLEDTH